MSNKPPSDAGTRLGSWPAPAQWLALVALSVLLAGGLRALGFPAATLVGPMLAGIAVSLAGARLTVPGPASMAAQALIGLLIAGAFTPAVIPELVADGPVLLAVVVATLAASGGLGLLIARAGVLPGTVGVWGATPGAATAMVLMAEAFGADPRLVAFMQYLRVIMVTAAAALIARLWVGQAGPAPAVDWFPPLDWAGLAATVAVGAGGVALGRLVRLPAADFLGPTILGVAVATSGVAALALPPSLLAAANATIGVLVGLRFTRATLDHVRRALPRVVLSILALMAFCGGLAVLLTRYAGVDPLTAYLATSPGGMDSVAIIAAASGHVDLTFVMTLQMLRFLIVLLFGPSLARLAARCVA